MATSHATARSVWTATLVSLVVFAVCALVLPLTGSVPIDYIRAVAGEEPDHQILFALRLPRVLLGLITGGALGLSGVLFQALLRDALATPYTLGVSTGAALGAVIAISAGLRAIWPASVLCAILTLALVLGVAANRRTISPFTLLMAGVTINSICLAAILFLHSIASFGQSIAITQWLMGGIETTTWPTLAAVSAVVIAAAIYSFTQARNWNLLSVGEEWAAARGVSAGNLMIAGYLTGSIVTGAVTALTGPIGFVGLIVPHALRLSLGADHRLLIPASFLLGGAFLAICDTISRTILAPAEIPVGVITAILGGPFFIWMLRSRGKIR